VRVPDLFFSLSPRQVSVTGKWVIELYSNQDLWIQVWLKCLELNLVSEALFKLLLGLDATVDLSAHVTQSEAPKQRQKAPPAAKKAPAKTTGMARNAFMLLDDGNDSEDDDASNSEQSDSESEEEVQQPTKTIKPSSADASQAAKTFCVSTLDFSHLGYIPEALLVAYVVNYDRTFFRLLFSDML
jgi:hypothetical protein